MKLRQYIAKCILTLVLLASVIPTLAETIYNVFSNINPDRNGTIIMCNKNITAQILIMVSYDNSGETKRINAEIYKNENDANSGNISNAVAVYTDKLPNEIIYTLNRADINPNNDPVKSQTYYVRITLADGSSGVWVENLTFEVHQVDDIDVPEIEPYCAGNMLVAASLIAKYSKYSVYDENDVALQTLEAVNKIQKYKEGDPPIILRVDDGKCKSDGIYVTLPAKTNVPPVLSTNYLSYTSSDISNGSFKNDISEQGLALNGKTLIENPYNCKITGISPDGEIISDFEHFTPPIPEDYETEIKTYSIKKDCGCAAVDSVVQLTIIIAIIPKPTVTDLEFCVDDPRGKNGFDAIIGNNPKKNDPVSNYTLEFSEYEDMRDAVSLPAGEMHFDYTFDVSAPSKKTYYVRQKQKPIGFTKEIYSETVSFDVVVSQPNQPVLTNQSVCANTTQSLALSTICSETNLIWKDATDNIITGSIDIKKRGDITVSAYKYEIINGTQCLSKPATATIHTDSLGVEISGDNILLPGQTGNAEVKVKGSSNTTISWSSSEANAIVGDINKSKVSVTMGNSDITLTSAITDGTCSQSATWTIQADLFQCPRPTANDINLCINDPRAANGFDADITLENSADDKSNYILSVSKYPDMRDATDLAAGETHFNYIFDASTVGEQKMFIRQTELSRNMSSAIVTVNITVSQPTPPSTRTAALCLNDDNEIKLSDLSSDSNLQWYDENKNKLTTVARFNKRGTHTLYAKRYEMVDGEECWSDFASTTITTDSIGIKLDGDNHLCPLKNGAVTVEETGTAVTSIAWTSDMAGTISNTTSPTVNVNMGNDDINLKCTVLAGLCQASDTWNITVGSGKVSGKIKFTEGEKVRTSNSLANAELSSCGGNVTVEATITHTSSDFTVRKGGAEIGTYSFDGDVAKFDIQGAGVYSVVYGNDCETSFSFNVTEMVIQPIVTTTKWSSCYGGEISAEISNVDGCKVVWKKDGTEIAKDVKTLKISNVTANDIANYSYELVCDGCPADGDVSSEKPDIYSPLTVTISQSADTICQGDAVDVDLNITPNSDKVSYAWTTGDDIQVSNSGASATLTPYFSKSYNVVVRNGDCDQQLKSINVNVHIQMNGNIEAGLIMCEGDSTQVDASGLDAERYEWEHTDSDSPIITVVPNNVENKYTVTAYRGKCVLEKEFVLMVGATPKLASIDSIGLDDVRINMETVGDYKFIVDGKNNTIDVTDNEKKHVGFGNHTLRIIDVAGCITDTSFYVVEPPFEIQNFISPGSDGENATFKIPDAVVVYSTTTMSIYDRWGKKLVTLTASDNEGWDGTYNGQDMPSADYWYELNVDAIDKTYFGHFTLIRE